MRSLTQVDEFPLYTMQYHGKYQTALPTQGTGERVAAGGGPRTWACSLFAALAAGSDRLYGRNFDWQFSPALLLFTDPPDGYASVSMVDLAYLFEADLVRELVDLPLADRKPLLDAPFWPFDGMNEHGLTVGMAAVPSTPAPSDKDKPTIDSLAIIREMLDHAQDVDEAVEILASYSILWGGGPTLHYLVADRAGKAALVEFYQGEMVVLPNENAWHLATNFLRRQADESGMHDCWRYDQMGERLTESQGQLTPQRALDLLAQVAQPSTQWSMVYNMTTGEIAAVMGRDWEDVEAFRLGIAGH